jgi:gas vesicle protein
MKYFKEKKKNLDMSIYRTNFYLLCLLLLGIFTVSSVNGANVTYNLTVDNNFWCQGQEITFTIYNASEYEDRESIEDDEDRNFTDLSDADVVVYNGPFDSSPILKDTSANKSNEFSATFSDGDNYLIEIDAGDSFKKYKENFQPESCPYLNGERDQSDSNDEEQDNIEQTDEQGNSSSDTDTTDNNVSDITDQSYSYLEDSLEVSLSETDISEKSQLTVQEISSFSDLSMDAPENMIQAVEIFSTEGTFSEMELVFNTSGENVTVLNYNQDFEEWNEIEPEQRNEESIVISATSYGIYALSGQDSVNTTQSDQTPSESDSPTTQAGSEEPQLPGQDRNSGNGILIPGILVALLVLVLAGGGGQMYLHHKKKEKIQQKGSSQQTSQSVQNQQHQKENTTLQSYNDVYSHVKEYVKQYHQQYSKDQIYRALKQANVPDDIINQVFSEFYS